LSDHRAKIVAVTEETWRPLGVDSDEDIAEYDALHDGVPEWMATAFWTWIRESITIIRTFSDGSGRIPMVRETLTEEMCQSLKIPLPPIRMSENGRNEGRAQFKIAVEALANSGKALAIADYLLAHADHARADVLEAVLSRAKSAWAVGTRAGRRALTRRVPLGVHVAADSVMDRAGRAGVRLARAWEELYSIEPNASAAYGLAIKAVEDAAIPVVSPTNSRATLGTVLAQIESQGDWRLPMEREHDKAPSTEVLAGMMRLLWHGQHDRHGGQPSAPGDVSVEEATVAVSLAVTLVNLFSSALFARAAARADSAEAGPGLSSRGCRVRSTWSLPGTD
jgi:hypothetical protein